MRIIFFYILIIFNIGFATSQQTNYLHKIDSIQENIFNSKSKDSSLIAKAHYNIGELYRYNFLTDSAYFHYHRAEKIYKSLNERYRLAITLYGIAVIQKDEKDFTGSEVTSIEAISLLESLDETNDVRKYKAFIYNNLGIVFKELELFEESISYHIKALDLKEKLVGNYTSTINNSKNNLANAYKNSKEFDLALKWFDDILANKELIKERPDFYVLVLDNYAHTQYQLKRYEELPRLYLQALKISDSLNEGGYNSIAINQHLAEYYNDNNKKDSALYYAYKAKDISENYHNDDLLKSLMLLSKIEEGDKAAQHLKAYVKLSDSLQKVERQTRNKFARIRFETDQIEQENIQIARERLWLLIISIVLIISSFLIYVIITQRNKNKELQFIQRQQKANEEIYNLMLSQNESIEEARTIEKQRISQELHDGVLGRLFGTRLSLDSLNMDPSPDAVKTRAQYIDELKTIEQDIRKVSHELNTDFVSGSGFIDIIKTLIETQAKVYNLEYNLDYADAINWDGVSNKKKIHIYRLLQESLHNIYKHANATHIKISFKLKNGVICLIIEDDGSGFDVNKAKSGIGLKNMNARIEEINGKIEITSEKEIGTQVSIEVPIP
ncbi:tetratricopeptide repeat-containing sensor histidine kinase [Hyunsoonleella aestuarii]|uniref:Histidine kinase domain-containing protein n=1 Tax=Hyunsoonleella aestuarii TaxID=912802 RepID=A0ABP8E806_9FLAO|nr:sensor histidine kinase [Hyunsoonleella aestuarii]